MANRAATSANRPQPSDAQKPQGRASCATRCASARARSRIGRSDAAFMMDMTAIPLGTTDLFALSGHSRRTAAKSVSLDRQADDDRHDEERQYRDVEDKAERRKRLLRRAIHRSENAEPNADQVDEGDQHQAEAEDHGEFRR